MTHHSTVFAPLVSRLCRDIEAHSTTRAPVLVAIDGRCASGKSTLAAALSQRLQAPVIHMDDFFLRPHMRTPERLAQPGGNVDKERFYAEVLSPLNQGRPCTYRPYSCHLGALTDPVKLPDSPIYIIEGTYSLCPELRPYYHVRVFLTVEPQTQLLRIEKRNGSVGLEAFKTRWIPLEEAYFSAFPMERDCDMTADTTDLF